MALRSMLLSAAAAAALLLLQACASPSPALQRAVEIEPGRRTRVAFVDFSSNVALVLQNASSGSPEEVYSDQTGNAMVKVVEDEELQRLLDVLAEVGMFHHARTAPLPEARSALVVEHEGGRMVWTRPTAGPGNLAEVRAFDQGRGYVMAVYNIAIALHSRTLDDPDMARVRQSIQEARASKDGPSKDGPSKDGQGRKP